MSLGVSLYCVPVEPAIAVQLPPVLLQRSHWYVKVMEAPVHVPRLTVTVWPSTHVPDTLGGLLFTGAFAFTTSVGFDADVCEPDEFVAVTRTRIRDPTSAEVRTYVVPVAPAMFVQLLPSELPPSVPQRTHWYANVMG